MCNMHTFIICLTIRASLAPCNTQRTLLCILRRIIFTQGPEGPFRAPCDTLFLLKGLKGPSVQPATHFFYSRAQRALPFLRKSGPIGQPFSIVFKKKLATSFFPVFPISNKFSVKNFCTRFPLQYLSPSVKFLSMLVLNLFCSAPLIKKYLP